MAVLSAELNLARYEESLAAPVAAMYVSSSAPAAVAVAALPPLGVGAARESAPGNCKLELLDTSGAVAVA